MRLDILLLFILICIGIGLVACSPSTNPTPTIPPTLFPSITLTVYNPRFITTLTPQSTPSATIIPPSPEFRDVTISPPICYPSQQNQVTCLGYVNNEHEQNLADVTLRASINGTRQINTKLTLLSLEQRVIPAGELAPYRIQFARQLLEEASLQIGLESARFVEENHLRMQWQEMLGTYDANHNLYQFAGVIQNLTAVSATQMRLIVTLENSRSEIIGYRAIEMFDDLPSGESRAIELSITPLETTMEIRHRVTIEAFQSEFSPTPAG